MQRKEEGARRKHSTRHILPTLHALYTRVKKNEGYKVIWDYYISATRSQPFVLSIGSQLLAVSQ